MVPLSLSIWGYYMKVLKWLSRSINWWLEFRWHFSDQYANSQQSTHLLHGANLPKSAHFVMQLWDRYGVGKCLQEENGLVATLLSQRPLSMIGLLLESLASVMMHVCMFLQNLVTHLAFKRLVSGLNSLLKGSLSFLVADHCGWLLMFDKPFSVHCVASVPGDGDPCFEPWAALSGSHRGWHIVPS